jgi:hypothetical protein
MGTPSRTAFFRYANGVSGTVFLLTAPGSNMLSHANRFSARSPDLEFSIASWLALLRSDFVIVAFKDFETICQI